MKPFPSYFFAFIVLFIFSTTAFSQNAVSPPPTKQPVKSVKFANIDAYLTERDYNEQHGIVKAKKEEIYFGDEIYGDGKEKEKKKERDSILHEVPVEIVVEVVVNALFIVATFWQW